MFARSPFIYSLRPWLWDVGCGWVFGCTVFVFVFLLVLLRTVLYLLQYLLRDEAKRKGRKRDHAAGEVAEFYGLFIVRHY